MIYSVIGYKKDGSVELLACNMTWKEAVLVRGNRYKEFCAIDIVSEK